MINNVDMFKLYIRMSNAKNMFSSKADIDDFVIGILEFIDRSDIKPYSKEKGKTDYPQKYDCDCINKFRSLYGLDLYTYVDQIGIVKNITSENQ